MKEIITNNFEETQKLGEDLAQEILSGEKPNVVCLEGELGSGKTTFTQGLLKGLGVEGPYTSPTFLVMKEYKPHPDPLLKKERRIMNIYHIDAYRVGSDDILALGWGEIISDPKNIVIVEWSDRIKNILPERCINIKFEWLDEDRREIKID